MEVIDVEAIPLAAPLEGPTFGDARGRNDGFGAALVRVELDDATVGWGEAFAPAETVTTLIDELLADAMIGEDPHRVQSLAERTRTGETNAYHFGGSPFLQSAISGIDVACWDAIGRARNEPVHRLLGGDRETVTPYASTGYISPDLSIEEQIEEAAAEGFTAAKIKVGSSPEEDVARVEATREILGEDATLMVDFNGNYTAKGALESIRALEPYDLAWVEEPVPPEDYEGYRKLQRRVDVPLAAGEAHFYRDQFRRLADGLVDVLQPNVCHVGGFSEARFVADLGTTENVTVRPHVWNCGVGLAAALQFLASVPDYPHSYHVPDPVLFEFDRSPNPLRTGILEEPLDPTGGELAVPDDPGLGIDVDEDAVEAYRTN